MWKTGMNLEDKVDTAVWKVKKYLYIKSRNQHKIKLMQKLQIHTHDGIWRSMIFCSSSHFLFYSAFIILTFRQQVDSHNDHAYSWLSYLVWHNFYFSGQVLYENYWYVHDLVSIDMQHLQWIITLTLKASLSQWLKCIYNDIVFWVIIFVFEHGHH